MGLLNWISKQAADFQAGKKFPPAALPVEMMCSKLLSAIILDAPGRRLSDISSILANRRVAGYIVGFPVTGIGQVAPDMPLPLKAEFAQWVTQSLFTYSTQEVFWKFAFQLTDQRDDDFMEGFSLGEADWLRLVGGRPGWYPRLPLLLIKGE